MMQIVIVLFTPLPMSAGPRSPFGWVFDGLAFTSHRGSSAQVPLSHQLTHGPHTHETRPAVPESPSVPELA